MKESKFYYYVMSCKDNGYHRELKSLVKKQNWEDNTKSHNITHSDGTLDEIVIEKTDESYFGKIIRTKPKKQYFGKNEGENKVEDLNTKSELIGEKANEITYFAFLPYGVNDLLFLIELHFGSRGMKTIRNFFDKCISQSYEFRAEPLKTLKVLNLKKLAPKELKTIKFVFRRDPTIPEGMKAVEDVLKRLTVTKDYQVSVITKIREYKNKPKLFATLDKVFDSFFGKGLNSAIDEGIDIPDFLSNIKVSFKEDEESDKTQDILKNYERESIRLEKGNLEDIKIKKFLFDSLNSKLNEVSKK